jgi:phage tail-like protein
MVEGLTIPEIKTGPSRKPPVGFHFAVIFYKDGVEPNSIDMYFKKVSGLSSEIETVSYKEGGENLFTHRLPNRVSYNNLVLERLVRIFRPPCPR